MNGVQILFTVVPYPYQTLDLYAMFQQLATYKAAMIVQKNDVINPHVLPFLWFQK
jgi:hypothetical protein